MAGIDRNKAAKDEFAVRRARKQFADGMSAGQTGLRDRFGHLITEGANIIYLPPATGLVYTVVDVRPLLDPGAPPGLVTVTLTTTAPFQGGVNQNGMLRLSEGKAEDATPPSDEAVDEAAYAADEHDPAGESESAIKLTD